MLRCFHKPTTSLFFLLLVFQQFPSNLLSRMLSKLNCGRSWHLLLHSFITMIYLPFFCSGGIVMLLSSTHHLVLPRSCFFRAYPFNRSVVSSLQVLFILSSLASLFNQSAARISSSLFLVY